MAFGLPLGTLTVCHASDGKSSGGSVLHSPATFDKRLAFVLEWRVFQDFCAFFVNCRVNLDKLVAGMV